MSFAFKEWIQWWDENWKRFEESNLYMAMAVMFGQMQDAIDENLEVYYCASCKIDTLRCVHLPNGQSGGKINR